MLKTKKKDIWFVITIGILALYLLFLVYPLINLLRVSMVDPATGGFSLAYFVRFFSKKYYYSAIGNSIKVTTVVTVLAILLAVPLAYILNFYKIRCSGAVQILILISSVSPPFIGAYSWILLLGRSGVITNFFKGFGVQVPSIYGFGGIVLVLTLQLCPLIFMYVSGALKTVDNSLVEAAESMNCTGMKKISKIILPLIVPTLLAGGLLVFMRAMADFGTPMLIGEGYRTIPVLIYNEFISEMGGEDGFAAAISVLVVIFATVVFLIQKFVSNRKAITMNALHPVKPKKVTGVKNALMHAFVYIYILVAMAPQLYVIYTSFLNVRGKLFIPGFSLQSYQIAFSKIGDSIFNTLKLAIIAILIIIALAVLVAYVTIRRPSLLTNLMDVATMFPYIVPGSILGIALLITFNKPPIAISGTAVIMVLAFAIRRLPYTIRSSSAILHQMSISTEEAAISLGSSKMKTFFKVTLPGMLSGVFSGAILSWITILSELSTSVLLYTTTTRTMSIAIYTEVSRGNYGTAAALSTILSVITIISLLLFFKITGKKEFSM